MQLGGLIIFDLLKLLNMVHACPCPEMGWASNFDSCWGQPAKRFNSEIGMGSDGSRYGSKIESLKQWGTFLPSSKCYLWPITSFQCSMITEVKRGKQHETTGSQLSRGSQCQETLCFGVSQNMYIIVHPHKKLQEKVSSVSWDIHLKLIILILPWRIMKVAWLSLLPFLETLVFQDDLLEDLVSSKLGGSGAASNTKPRVVIFGGQTILLKHDLTANSSNIWHDSGRRSSCIFAQDMIHQSLAFKLLWQNSPPKGCQDEGNNKLIPTGKTWRVERLYWISGRVNGLCPFNMFFAFRNSSLQFLSVPCPLLRMMPLLCGSMWCIVGASSATSGEVLEESCGRRSVGSPMTKLPKFRFSVDFFSRPKKSQELVNDLYAKGWGRVFSIGGRDYNCFYWRSSFNVFLCVMKSSSVHSCRGSMPSS